MIADFEDGRRLWTKECVQPLKAGKGKEIDSPVEIPLFIFFEVGLTAFCFQYDFFRVFCFHLELCVEYQDGRFTPRIFFRSAECGKLRHIFQVTICLGNEMWWKVSIL